MAKQIGSNKIAHQILFKNSVDKNDTARFLYQHIQPKTQLRTDGSAVYKRIDKWWQVKHKKDIHNKLKFGLTSEIEGMFGNLRTFIRRMRRRATSEYLPEYASEFCVRFSSPEIFDSPLSYLEKVM